MNYTEAYHEIKHLLEDNANSYQAIDMSRYMRDQFQFYGVKSPLRKELVREIKKTIKPIPNEEFQELIQFLWDDPYRECQYVAMDLLATIKSKMGMDWIDFLEDLITTKSWWDTVDFLAPNLLGNIFKRNVEVGNEYTDKWIKSDNIWLQRSALIYQLRYKDQVDFQRLSRYILYQKESKEFFIRKAAGWALRQYSKFKPESVRDFINNNTELSNLTKKEAIKYLD